MKKIINRVIGKIKKEEYSLDKEMSKSYLVVLIIRKIIMLVRGFFCKLFLKKSEGLLFLGKYVKLNNKRKIEFYGTAIIDDGAKIDALSKKGIKIGKNFSLGRNSIIECTGVLRELGEELVIGDNVGISANSFIGVRGKTVIGNDTIMGPYVSIHSENHTYIEEDRPIRLQKNSRKGIFIGNNCWIGAKVTILDGVKIGDNCIIGAGSVVTHDIESNSVAVGVPAKVIKKVK